MAFRRQFPSYLTTYISYNVAIYTKLATKRDNYEKIYHREYLITMMLDEYLKLLSPDFHFPLHSKEPKISPILYNHMIGGK